MISVWPFAVGSGSGDCCSGTSSGTVDSRTGSIAGGAGCGRRRAGATSSASSSSAIKLSTESCRSAGFLESARRSASSTSAGRPSTIEDAIGGALLRWASITAASLWPRNGTDPVRHSNATAPNE